MTTTLDPVADPPQQRTHALSSRQRLLAAILFVTLAVWLLSPALTATHVEAFSARLQTMAMLDLHGHLTQDDLAYPVSIEYFLATRGGTVYALEWLMRLTHSTGPLNWRILITLSYLLFVASSVVFVRRWSREPVWATLAVLVLTPGLTEISFFFADNLPSAALVTLAIALMGTRTPLWRWVAAGVLLASATLLRIDALIATPFLLFLALLQQDSSRPRLLRNWLLTLLGATATFYLSWRLTHISLWQSLRVTQIHNSIHNSWGDRQAYVRVVVLFFGPTLLLLAVGVAQTWRNRSRAWNLVMIVWPVLFYAAFMYKVVELRDYLLLGAPFLLLHGASGLTAMLRYLAAGTPRQRLFARTALAFFFLVLFTPPMLILHDGPRVFLGRIYSPPMWRRWQRSTDSAVHQLQALAASTPPGQRTLLLSTFFQPDRYLHLALLEDGYTIQPLRANPNCGAVETYTKDSHTIFHVRTENPWWLLSDKPMKMPGDYVLAYQTNAGLTCLAPSDYDSAYMLTWGRLDQGYLLDSPQFQRNTASWEMPFPEPGIPRIGRIKYLQVQRILPLAPEDITSLIAGARWMMHAYEIDNYGQWTMPQTYAQFHTQAEPLVIKSLPTLKPPSQNRINAH